MCCHQSEMGDVVQLDSGHAAARRESWYMEGLLKGGVHYIEVKPDYSDLLSV